MSDIKPFPPPLDIPDAIDALEEIHEILADDMRRELKKVPHQSEIARLLGVEPGPHVVEARRAISDRYGALQTMVARVMDDLRRRDS